MKRKLAAGLVVLCASIGLTAQAVRPAIFISPTGDGFDVYIAAAIQKKNVPATVVAEPKKATLTLKAAQVEYQKESKGMKVAKCLIQACANTGDKGSASVQLLDNRGSIVWSYAVDGDDTSKKELAEMIASKLKKDLPRLPI
ncbi:MAG TPA: hypothetical protein VHZ73_05150 [Vicinamibacterales bacterium]|jgi:hypothetical protein|nr:hypothetical protein [Vicinamibacterales bacterium]